MRKKPSRKRAAPKLYSWVIAADDLARFEAIFREAGVVFRGPLTACRGWAEADGTPRRIRGQFGPGESCQINLRRDRTFSMTHNIAIRVNGTQKASAS